MIKYNKNLFLLIVLILVSNLFSADKNHSSYKVTSDSDKYDEYVIDTGDLVNYVSNSTGYNIGSEYFTFLIGNANDDIPSMNWRVGNYDPNSYLYYGAFFIGCNHDIVRFSTKTSNDFKVLTSEPGKIGVRFSMTDDSTESYDKFGVKCICNIHAFYNDLINDFIIYEYTIINQSDQLLENIYTGFYIDGDLSTAAGGSGIRAYSRDDMSDYYLGIDRKGNPESISYMYDADNPNIPGDDTGGILSPKESLGFLGSRVLESPETKYGVSADQQSGHQWWDWGSAPDVHIIGEHYRLMKSEEFKPQPRSPHDYRYFQTMGPWDIDAKDTLVVAYALGIGNGLDGLRKNMQYAYDLYQSNDLAPKVLYYSPISDTIITHIGETVKFCIKGADSILYSWGFNDYTLANYDSVYTYKAINSHLGKNLIFGEVSDNQYSRGRQWVLIVKPAKKYQLFQNYPNPFNGFTKIPFELEKDGNVEIAVYDVLGKKVKTLTNKPYTFGKHEITWDGRNVNGNAVASGFYFYQIKTENYKSTKQMLFMK
jgi:type IX secretion system substrate protein